MINIDIIANQLNSLLDVDPEAMENLFSMRVPCRPELAVKTTVPCAKHSDGTYTVGILGLLNGLLSRENQELVMMTTDGDGIIMFYTKRRE